MPSRVLDLSPPSADPKLASFHVQLRPALSLSKGSNSEVFGSTDFCPLPSAFFRPDLRFNCYFDLRRIGTNHPPAFGTINGLLQFQSAVIRSNPPKTPTPAHLRSRLVRKGPNLPKSASDGLSSAKIGGKNSDGPPLVPEKIFNYFDPKWRIPRSRRYYNV